MNKKIIFAWIPVICLFALILYFKNDPVVHPLKETATKAETTEREVTASITGDLLFEGPLYEWMDNYQFGNYFDQVKPYLKGDLIIGNQEVLVGGDELGISGWVYSFNAPYSIGEQLPSLGFNVLTLANNHENDRGLEGITNTRQLFDKMNMFTSGMYLSQEERNQTPVIEKNGVRFGVLAYTYSTNTYVGSDYDYAVPYFLDENLQFTQEYKDILKRDVEAAKQVSDVVIVAMHWGTEFTYELTYTQQAAAEYLNELGVDLIIGNHAHCLQPMEYLTSSTGHQTFVIYSLGNFVSADVVVDRSSELFKNMYQVGGIVNLTICHDTATKETTIKNVVLTPFVNQYENEYQNFRLIPFNQYNETLASQHYRRQYSDLFTYEVIKEQIEQLYDESIMIN